MPGLANLFIINKSHSIVNKYFMFLETDFLKND